MYYHLGEGRQAGSASEGFALKDYFANPLSHS